MIATKSVLTVASVTFVAVMLYMGGHSDGHDGMASGLIGESFAAKIAGGKLDVKDVIQPTYNEINKKYGINEKQD